MKEHFNRKIDQHTYTFRRIDFPSGTWYQVHTVVQDQAFHFWMKRGSSGRWKIQPQLLPEDILGQEQAFTRAIQEREAKALYP